MLLPRCMYVILLRGPYETERRKRILLDAKTTDIRQFYRLIDIAGAELEYEKI